MNGREEKQRNQNLASTEFFKTYIFC
jgi:hypothetical protein